MADPRRPPLSRGDSSVSARDSSYWLAVASARSYTSSVSSGDSARGLDASFLRALSGTGSSRRALWDLRGQTILPSSAAAEDAMAGVAALSLSSAAVSGDDGRLDSQENVSERKMLKPPSSLFADMPEYADVLLVPTRHAVPRSTRGAASTSVSVSANDADADAAGVDRRMVQSMPAGLKPAVSGRSKASSLSTDLSKQQGGSRRHRPSRAVIVAEVVYENQRHQHVLGWGSKGHLLPLDPAKYTRAVRKPLHSTSDKREQGVGGVLRRRSFGEYPFRSRSANNDDRLDPHSESARSSYELQDVPVKWVNSNTFPDATLPDVVIPQVDSKKASKNKRIDDREQRSKQAAALRRLSTTSRWEWVSPWHLEFPTHFPTEQPRDSDGWEYATSFQHFATATSSAGLSEQLLQRRRRRAEQESESDSSQSVTDSTRRSVGSEATTTNPLVYSSWRPRCHVRRRKWVRFRRLRSGRSSSETRLSHTSAFDDSFLDSMSGWLKKLGHVRKNWKARYFVLEKSILRYYSDESRCRLKGEVLLFHPATRVHYVDIHLTGGRDNTFAIQVGADYTLLLQAERLSDRENWIYCIEDALLCRDSYFHDPEHACDLRESVAQRRMLSSEALAFDLQDRQLPSANGQRHRAASNLVNLVASLHSKSDGVLRAATKSPVMLRLLRLCDYFLESDEMKLHIADFIGKFKQKYSNSSSRGSSSGSVSPVANTPAMRNSDPLFGISGTPDSTQRSSMSDFPPELVNVTVLQDARSLLALKNYRFFLERSLERIVEYLSDQSFAETAKLTSPRGSRRPSAWTKQQGSSDSGSNGVTNPENGDDGPSDDEWQMTRRAALFKLERLTFIPLQETIYRLLESTVAESDMELFERNRRYLATQPPSFFEIPKALTSPSEWKTATLLLNTMDNYSLPSEKASVLLEVARCIFETQVREHGDDEKAVTAMSADDFLPIFIFVLARCRLRSVVISRHLISETMISAMMIGETGYYATMLEAAIGYVASFDFDEAVASRDSTSSVGASAAGRVSASSTTNTASLSE